MLFYLLTILLFILKETGIITISWWLVVIPSLVYLVLIGLIMYLSGTSRNLSKI